MNDGEHKDFGSTSVPLLHQELDPSSSSQKLLVVVTLAALVIAGSTIAYRTRSYPFSAFPLPSTKEISEDVSSSGQDQAQGKAKPSAGGMDVTGESSVNGDDGDDSRSQAEGSGGGKEKEGKSSRKKDRRKRGKDPLKEILKGKAKGKALDQLLESTTQTSTTSSASLSNPANKTSNVNAIPNQKLSNGTTSGADMDPGKASTHVADVSQNPHSTAASRSSLVQSPSSSSLSTSDIRLTQRKLGPPDNTHPGARTNGEESPSSVRPDSVSPTPDIPVSSSSSKVNHQSSTAYDVDVDGVPNGTPMTARPLLEDDQALGARVGGLAVNIAGPPSSTPVNLRTNVEGESAEEMETTNALSTTSSIVLSESDVTPRRGAEEAEGTPVTSAASSEKSGRTPKVDAGAAKLAVVTASGSERKAQLAGKPQPLVDPWDWDGVSTGGSSPVASTSSSKNAQTRHTTSSRVSTPGSSTTHVYTSFSEVVSNQGKTLATVTSSDTHSRSDKMSALTSVSGVASTRNGVPSLSGALVGEGVDEGTSKEKEEEEPVFTFPTLNPTTSTTSAGAGPSRIRSSLGDVHSNTTTAHLTSAATGRASPSLGGKRRPPTPSRNNSHSHTRNVSNGTPPPRPMTPSSAGASGVESPTTSQAKPALSVQTQLASMRGALEASRIREEKNKAEIEKYIKEIDTMKWENANWRRAEIELQTQIRSLMHQLQMYTSIFAANAHLQQQYAAHAAGAPPSHLNTPATPSPAPLYSTQPTPSTSSASSTSQAPSTAPEQSAENATSTPSQGSQPTLVAATTPSQPPNSASVPQHPAPQPLNLHMMHVNGISSPSAMLSPSGPMSPGFPMAPYPGAPPPFFPYAIPPHLQPASPQVALAHAQQLHMQQYQQHQASLAQSHVQAQAMSSPHQPSLFSVMFPPASSAHHAATNHFGGAPTSAAGTSSAGSQSPDRSASPTSNGSLSKRRSRTRMQTAGGRITGRSMWEEAGDGWVGTSSIQDAGNDGEGVVRNKTNDLSDDDAASEGGFNEVLADAIFKRPANIRMRSSSRSLRSAFEGGAEKSSSKGSSGPGVTPGASEEAEQFTTEFTFPSLTDMGTIIYQSSVKSSNSAYSSGTSTSTSSSLSLSPAVVVSDVTPEVPEETAASNDVHAEEERPHSLPTLVEQPEDNDGHPAVDTSEPVQSSDLETTPREEHPIPPPSSAEGAQYPEGDVSAEDTPVPSSAEQ